ncbi:MAG: PBP1A family penicillin-binding protein [Desulfobacteraceae bacterium]|jgi:penicillin-binding protein 1A
MGRWLKVTLGLFILILLAIGGVGAHFWYMWSSNLPYIGSLKDYHPPIISEIVGSKGEVIGRFWDEKRIVIPLERMPRHLIQAFVSAEDDRFYEHKGVDFYSIFRAFIKNIQAGKIAQGGSTITQQVTRSLLLKNPEKTYRRKAREALLSLQIEKTFSKERILFLYLNQIYLGHGAYGVEAAARTYFGKPASELTLAECALLAGLPQAPSRYSAFSNFARAKERQRYVLERMVEEAYISREEANQAFAQQLTLDEDKENPFAKAPYFTEHIRKYLEETYGREALYRGGLRVMTTVDLDMQRKGQVALEQGLRDLDKREGYRGPIRSLAEEEIEAFRKEAAEVFADDPAAKGRIVQAVVLEVDDEEKRTLVGLGDETGVLPLERMTWARKPDPHVHYAYVKVKRPGTVLKKGDVILVRMEETAEAPHSWVVSLEQEPEVQGSILCLESNTGRVLAMVGGRDYQKSQFNRAVQARRQPGSAFKPLIYAAALDNGMSPSTVILDAPYVASMQQKDKLWRPENYKKTFSGRTLLRTGLIKSMNVITIKILKRLGVSTAIEYARGLGIESELSPNLSLALGSSGLSLLELTRAYAVFENGGMMPHPYAIERVEDREGNVLEENQPHLTRAISQQTAFVMTNLLQGVVREGTGWRIKALKRPAAGKTGTTNDLRDAWFMGFTPGLVTGVWVGYDDRIPMGRGETGSRAASPIWLQFMQSVLEGTPVKDFQVPQGVVFAKIDAKEGLLASAHSEKTVFQAYKEGSEPQKYVPEPTKAKSGQFSQFDMDFAE